jgi:hypothetical protein
VVDLCGETSSIAMISWTMDRDKPSRYFAAKLIQRTEVDGMQEKEVLFPWLHDRVAMRADSQGDPATRWPLYAETLIAQTPREQQPTSYSPSIG